MMALTDSAPERKLTTVPTLTIELPQHEAQTVFNLRRWAELRANPELGKFEGRIETDRHGHIIKSPPPAPTHGSFQSEIAFQLRTLMSDGRVLTECPISTADGVKAGDVAWASPACMRELGNRVCFPKSPEICAEILSPSNTDAEIQEKMTLFFDAGAKEVWVCSGSGAMSFFGPKAGDTLNSSRLCPEFPNRVKLR